MSGPTQVGGTFSYMAPELFHGTPSDASKCDVWAFACSILELATGMKPWKDLPPGHQLARMTGGEKPDVSECPENIAKVLCRCFNFESFDRPDFGELKAHFQQMEAAFLEQDRVEKLPIAEGDKAAAREGAGGQAAEAVQGHIDIHSLIKSEAHQSIFSQVLNESLAQIVKKQEKADREMQLRLDERYYHLQTTLTDKMDTQSNNLQTRLDVLEDKINKKLHSLTRAIDKLEAPISLIVNRMRQLPEADASAPHAFNGGQNDSAHKHPDSQPDTVAAAGAPENLDRAPGIVPSDRRTGIVTLDRRTVSCKSPLGLAVDSEGNIVVACSSEHRLNVINGKDGSIIRHIGTKTSGPLEGQFREPAGLSIDREGNILAADSKNHRVQKFNSQGKFLGFVGKDKGDGDGCFEGVEGIAVDSQGRILVSCRGRVQLFDKEGLFLKCIGQGKVKEPQGVAFDHSDFMIISDSENNVVHLFNAEGKFVRQLGNGFGAAEGCLSYPVGVAVDAENRILVADSQNGWCQP